MFETGQETPTTKAALSTAPAVQACAEKIGPKLLVVDDDPVNRMVINRLLSRESYQLVEAQSGDEALELMQVHRDIKLIILDVMMPRLSGYDTCNILRKNYDTCALPVIFLTAKDLVDDWVRGYLAGGNDFLTKPVSKQLLLEYVAVQLAPCEAELASLKPEERALCALRPVLPALNTKADLYELLQKHLLPAIEGSLRLSIWLNNQGHLQDLGSELCVESSEIEDSLRNIEQTRKVAFLNPEEQLILGTYLNATDVGNYIALPAFFADSFVGVIFIANQQCPNAVAINQLKRVKPLLVAVLIKLAQARFGRVFE
jgi:CheY-like chemotaxis protein